MTDDYDTITAADILALERARPFILAAIRELRFSRGHNGTIQNLQFALKSIEAEKDAFSLRIKAAESVNRKLTTK